MRVLALAIVAVVAIGCVSCSSSTAPSTPVAFTRVASFPMSELSASTVPAGQQVIRDAETWATVWSSLTGNMTPAPPLPAVDFARNVVLFTTMGKQPTSGYQTSISAVAASSVEQVTVTVDQTAPGSSCVVAPAFTVPADAVIVSKGVASFVQFKVNESLHQCG